MSVRLGEEGVGCAGERGAAKEEGGSLSWRGPVVSVGVDPAGVDPAGVDPAGVDPVGVDPVGVDR